MARYRPLAAALNRPIRVAVLISGGGNPGESWYKDKRQGS